MAKAQQLRRILNALPSGAISDEAELMKAALGPLVERMLATTGYVPPCPAGAGTCANCGGPAGSRSPYCSTKCKDTAAYVRRFRSALANGSVFDDEKQFMLGQALWSLQGGGFPARQKMIPEKVIAKVIARDGGVCSICGAPATQVDHVGSG